MPSQATFLRCARTATRALPSTTTLRRTNQARLWLGCRVGAVAAVSRIRTQSHRRAETWQDSTSLKQHSLWGRIWSRCTPAVLQVTIYAHGWRMLSCYLAAWRSDRNLPFLKYNTSSFLSTYFRVIFSQLNCFTFWLQLLCFFVNCFIILFSASIREDGDGHIKAAPNNVLRRESHTATSFAVVLYYIL